MGNTRRSSRVASAAATTAPKQPATKASAKTTKQANAPSQVKGLKGAPAPTTKAPLGIVDPQSGFTANASIVRDAHGAEYDAMLNLLDISLNMDKYFILQVVQEPKGRTVQYHCYTRWGRTGTAGSSQKFSASTAQEAIDHFEEKYTEKTGQCWTQRDTFVQKPGKYNLLKVDNSWRTPGVMWQYHVDDNVDGKPNGWHDYDEDAAAIVEDLLQQFLTNPGLGTRLVASGHFLYKVDLAAGTQTNTSTGRSRSIRRTVNGVVALVGGASATAPAASAAAAGTSRAAKRKGTAVAPPPQDDSSEGEEEADEPATPAVPVAAKASRAKRLKVAASVAAPATPPATKGKQVAPAPATPSPAARKGAASTSTPASKTKASAANWVSGQDLVSAMGSGSVDPTCPKAGTATLVAPHDVMLNQTDIKNNHNKFYLIQLIEERGKFFVWTRWGRVGDVGMSQLQGPLDQDGGEHEFANKFKAKTGNAWEDRASFVVKPGKYEIVEVEAAAAPTPAAAQLPTAHKPAALACSLDSTTQAFVDLIFNEDMFKSAMSAMELDPDRIPLGRLSKAQVQKGMALLEQIEDALQQGRSTQDLSSRFYQAIPHNWGRQRPPAITSMATLQQKFDLLNVLGDIEVAQGLASKSGSGSGVHPSDERYRQLAADLRLLPHTSAEFKMLDTYMKNTRRGSAQVENIWAVDRHGESVRFSPHAALANRKLLWHGTNIAVVAAILKSGLRIMPHSGGRVGRGIYLASECGKSQCYVSGTRANGRHVGVMFLVEAALGKEHHITCDNPSLQAPPKGCNSVVAQGVMEPPPASNTCTTLDGKPVVVPMGRPEKRPQYSSSSFANSEYLLYDESQHRIRYVLTVLL